MIDVINPIFKIIGIAADRANLLCEFKIDEKMEVMHIKIKNGKIMF